MNEQGRTLIYIGIAIVAAAVTWFARPAAPSRTMASEAGQAYFPDFQDPLAASSLELVEFDEETGTQGGFSVARYEGVWSIPTHDNYPADAENQFAEAVATVMELTKGATVSDDAKHHELYGVVDPTTADPGATGVGMRITVTDDREQPLADLIIGNEVKDAPSQYYAREPENNRVYLCNIDTKPFSTTFEDWIELDLLQVGRNDIAAVTINTYSIDELSRRVIEGDILDVWWNEDDRKWELGGLAEGEELDRTILNDMRNAIDQLKIVDVRRKPATLAASLRADDGLDPEALDAVAGQSLQRRGFFFDQSRNLRSNQGEAIVRCPDGIQYVLGFGEIALGTASGSTDEGEGEDQSVGLNRYLMVWAEFNPNLIPAPEPALLPEIREPAEDLTEEQAADAALRDTLMEQARVLIEQENKDKQQEYEAALEAAQERVAELNDRFADWFYVISDEVYQKVHLQRSDFVTSPEPIEPEVDPTAQAETSPDDDAAVDENATPPTDAASGEGGDEGDDDQDDETTEDPEGDGTEGDGTEGDGEGEEGDGAKGDGTDGDGA